MIEKTDKAFRLLKMHERLSKGESIDKVSVIAEFEIPSKTFQRDIDSLRTYYISQGHGELIYDRKRNCYRLQAKSDLLTKEEVFAVCKVLIESRAFNKIEFNEIIEKLLRQCEVPEGKAVKAVIANEQVNYIQLRHGKPLVSLLWQIAGCVMEQRLLEICYRRLDGAIRKHDIKPVGIMFSEFYFYLIAYMADDRKDDPTVFRVDRVVAVTPSEEHFCVPHAEKFSEAEFRKRVQFMYGGKLRLVRFLYRGSLEAMLDKLPTAAVEKQTDDGALVRVESYGNGIDMWLKSQGDKVEIL